MCFPVDWLNSGIIGDVDRHRNYKMAAAETKSIRLIPHFGCHRCWQVTAFRPMSCATPKTQIYPSRWNFNSALECEIYGSSSFAAAILFFGGGRRQRIIGLICLAAGSSCCYAPIRIIIFLFRNWSYLGQFQVHRRLEKWSLLYWFPVIDHMVT